MKLRKRIISIFAAALCCMSMSNAMLAAEAFDTEQCAAQTVSVSESNAAAKVADYRKKVSKGTASKNVMLTGYRGSYYASPMNSYLYEWNNNLYRLENINGKIILEKYNSDFKYLGKGEIKAELPIFGGFYAGKDYNFIIFGDYNKSDSRDKEILRVVKYTKGMKRVASKSFYGCNTYIPFDAGCPRMDEYNGVLYIHACHEMFKSSDGYHHQANMDFYLNIADMKPVFTSYGVSYAGTGYMSHSFNQFIKVNKNGIYTVDHGDAYNRAITAFRRPSVKSENAGYEDVFKIRGSIGDNYTGVVVGGMEINDDTMLISGASVPQDKSYGTTSQQNLFVITVPLSGSGKTSVNYLTNYKKSDKVTFSEPKLVKKSNNSFLLLWTETKDNKTKLYTCELDGKGNKVGKTRVYDGKLSDCQPIVFNGKVTFYVTENGAPVFYYL